MSTQETINPPDDDIIVINSGGNKVNITKINDGSSTVPHTEKPKVKKQPSKKSPKLAKDKPKELHAIGKFYAGIAELKVEKSNLELNRTQRIIFEEKGIKYEYIRNKNPY